VRVRFSNSYRGSADDAPILRVVGEKGAAFFKQSFELKIKGDLIPESAVEEIIGELQEIFARHGAGAALSAKAVFKPNKEFHTARHTLFSATGRSAGVGRLACLHQQPVRAPAGSGVAAAKAAQEVDDQGSHKDQPKGASAKDRPAEVKATAT
jgi:hypothetical protein